MKRKKLEEMIIDELAKCPINKNLDSMAKNIVNNVFIEKAKTICIIKKWIDDGAQIDNNNERMVREFVNGELICDNLLKLPLNKVLEMLIEAQADIFWLFNGAKKDNSKEQELKDYYDAKRYIGYLIADSIIEKCKEEKQGDKFNSRECYNHYLKKEYLPYLECLSVEEYLRIKAYFYWKDSVAKVKTKSEQDEDYFRAMQNIKITMSNCKKRGPKEFFDEVSLAKFLKEYDPCSKVNTTDRKNAKVYCNQRLNAEYIEADIGDKVTKFYAIMDKTLKNESDFTEKEVEHIKELLSDGFYKNTHIPNMLEFISKCWLHTYLVAIPAKNHIKNKTASYHS